MPTRWNPDTEEEEWYDDEIDPTQGLDDPWIQDTNSPWSYRGDAGIASNWNDFGLDDPTRQRAEDRWDVRQNTQAIVSSQNAAAEQRRRTESWDREKQAQYVEHLKAQLAQSLMLAREAAAARREEWVAAMKERAEAAAKELERMKRLDYSRTTGFTYALPGEPALPQVTYNQNYKPVAPLPPSRFSAPATGVTAALSRMG